MLNRCTSVETEQLDMHKYNSPVFSMYSNDLQTMRLHMFMQRAFKGINNLQF